MSLTSTHMPCQKHRIKNKGEKNNKRMFHLSRNWEVKLERDTTRHLRGGPVSTGVGATEGEGLQAGAAALESTHDMLSLCVRGHGQFPAPMSSVPTRTKQKETRLGGKSSRFLSTQTTPCLDTGSMCQAAYSRCVLPSEAPLIWGGGAHRPAITPADRVDTEPRSLNSFSVPA